jgi:putative endonuclease
MNESEKGASYERLALNYLRRHGLQLVERNFRCRLGEVDLILRDKTCLVFVEVRYRASNRFASATLSVDGRKQAKIARTAAIYLSQHPGLSNCTVRFDVVAFDRPEPAQCALQWTRDAFRV